VLFAVSIERHFWASHQLAMGNGSKEPAHSHNWVVVAEVSSETLDDAGIIMDFCRLEDMVDEVVGEFDNARLEGIGYFRRNNPSAENVAKYVYEKLEPQLPDDVKLVWVRVVEDRGCSAKFSK
jgi:6-pyruvoyltetrahydropterin/6-carboxytetrahydropterin synthase